MVTCFPTMISIIFFLLVVKKLTFFVVSWSPPPRSFSDLQLSDADGKSEPPPPKKKKQNGGETRWFTMEESGQKKKSPTKKPLKPNPQVFFWFFSTQKKTTKNWLNSSNHLPDSGGWIQMTIESKKPHPSLHCTRCCLLSFFLLFLDLFKIF